MLPDGGQVIYGDGIGTEDFNVILSGEKFIYEKYRIRKSNLIQ